MHCEASYLIRTPTKVLIQHLNMLLLYL